MGGSTKLMSSGAGGVILTTPGSIAADVTVNLPTQNSTLAINGPAFSAYAGSAQALTANTYTKVQLNTESFDTNSNFDSTTNYRFTPTVAGYYQFNASVANNTTVTVFSVIYKNGTSAASGNIAQSSTSNGNSLSVVSDLIYMNGSTDYIELYVISVGGASNTAANSVQTKMSGVLVRAA